MHMADALLSPAVGITMNAVSLGAIAWAATKIKNDELCEKKIPLMAVTGAFVFAAQMINFTIPVTGSSGHIGGGMLLAALLGGFPALLTITAVLLIQALFFADGGLLALGCNIFNLGVIPCFIIYPIVYRPLIRNKTTLRTITIVSIASVVAALQLGAFGVVLETVASGITVLPFAAFTLLMQPIHLAIGMIEGIVTAAVLCFVYKSRPEIIESAQQNNRLANNVPMKNVIAVLAAVAVVTGGLLSITSSTNPDGLEWSIEKITGTAELASNGVLHENAAAMQSKTAFMPGYEYKSLAENEEGSRTGTSVAGISGGVLTFLLAGITGFIITKLKSRQRKSTAG